VITIAAQDMTGDAVISDNGTYRYALSRHWSPGPAMPWLCLNPSKADASINDPSVLRMCGFARRDGYGGIILLNAYALRATDPVELSLHPDPVGPDNDMWIAGVAAGIRDGAVRAPFVVAWGANPMAAARVPRVMELLAGIPVVCLGTTRDGSPKHPLARGRERVPDDAPLVPWEARHETH
jgi:hypothetical protein